MSAMINAVRSFLLLEMLKGLFGIGDGCVDVS